MQLRDYQQLAVDTLCKYWEKSNKPCIMQLATGCHAKGHPILMADGTIKSVEDVKVGDSLMASNGIRVVKCLHRGKDKMYKITPVKGEPFVVNGGHILHLLRYDKRNVNCKTVWSRSEIDISVNDYLSLSAHQKHCLKLMYRGYHIEKENIGVPAWMIGAYIGDVHTFSESNRSTHFTNNDKPVLDKMAECCKSMGWEFEKKGQRYRWAIKTGAHRSEFKQMMFELGAMSRTEMTKMFPSNALGWSDKDRLDLLAGLLDTDGHYDNKGFDFISRHKDIAYGVMRLARSVGVMATIREAYKKCQGWTETRKYYRVCISGKGIENIPCVKWDIKPNTQKKEQDRTGFKVECVGDGDYYGFELDGDHLYLDGSMMVHHNSGKSVLLAEIANKVAPTPVLVLQPTKEILEQNYEKLVAVGVDPKDICICSGSANSWKIGAKFTLATIGTIAKWAEHCQHIGVVLVDEADVVCNERASSQYMKFFNALSDGVRIVGLTATPWRNVVFSAMYEDPKVYCRPLTRIATQGKSKFGTWFWSGGIIFKCEIPYLQSRGFLSKTVYHMAETDWSFVRDVPGRVDFDTGNMTKWMDIEANTSRFTQAIKWCLDNNLKTIVFTPNIDMNFRLKYCIEQLGGTAECMDSEHDSKKAREKKMADFRAGKFQFLVNVGMVGRGVDVPSVDAVVLCRPTKSLSLFCQYIGRCLRIDPSNPDKIATILDLAGDVERFGYVENIRMGKMKERKNNYEFYKDVIAMKTLDDKQHIWERVS